MVELTGMEALARIRLDTEASCALLEKRAARGLHVYAREASATNALLRARNFCPLLGAAEDAATGFVAATLHSERLIGEIVMLAVDPDAQDRGTGTALTEFATGWLRDTGMRIAMVETGGDDGHSPARRVYEKADYVLLPVARYFKAL